ncbi:response regulator [Paraburkholderia youngii]|uniref:response regulator n=1 Tax=Paraburkholderia youngii TaxID=2782701 RepID=UPI003D208DA2
MLPKKTHHRRRLLVVDDCQPGAEAITASLSLAGYEAQFVLSGMAVIQAVNGWTPEIALLDINMPDLDGFAVARQLRQHGQTHHIFIVAFTAQDEVAVYPNAIAAGFDAYCQKGSAPDSLLHFLEQIAGERGNSGSVSPQRGSR